MIKTRIIFLFTIFAASLFTGSCSSKPVSVNKTAFALGTYVKIIIVTEKRNRNTAGDTMENAYRMVGAYEETFDYRSRDGDLSLFNDGTSLARNGNEELFNLLLESLEYARFTKGFFDPTILPIVREWGFDTDSPALPENDAILQALADVGYENVIISDNRISKPIETKLDLSGIAKGKIVDLLRDFLIENGYSDFLIDAGGDIYVRGRNLNHGKWRIAIQDPIQKNRYSGVIETSNTSVVTSGDYENYFTHENTTYNHLFNPHTGYPDSDIKSVTVLTDDTAYGDAIATAVFAMGGKNGYRFLMDNGIEGLILFGEDEDQLNSLVTPHFWN